MQQEINSPINELYKSIQTFESLAISQECRDKLWRYNDALMQSLRSIIDDSECDADGKMQYFNTTLEQYVSAMKDLFPQLINHVTPPAEAPQVNCIGKSDPNRFDFIYEIEKYKSFHDSKGRFASAPGGGGAVGGISHRTVTGGGISIHVKSGKEPKSGYMCATYAERAEWIKGDAVKDPVKRTAAIKKFMEKNKDVLADKNNYLGTWYDTSTGNISLDISRNFSNKREAIKYAKEHNEKAIWDVKNMAEISTGGTGNNL